MNKNDNTLAILFIFAILTVLFVSYVMKNESPIQQPMPSIIPMQPPIQAPPPHHSCPPHYLQNQKNSYEIGYIDAVRGRPANPAFSRDLYYLQGYRDGARYCPQLQLNIGVK